MFIPLKDENPTSRFPLITLLFIGLNVVIFFYQIFSPEGLQYHVLRLGAIPYEITHFRTLALPRIPRLFPPLTLLTAMFLHGGLLHLGGNMLYLWIFGNNVEDYLGSLRFILFYLICGLAASFTHIIFNPNSTVPMIGASGAIAGILGAYLILFPHARVMTLVFLFVFIEIVPVPAAFFLLLWFFLQVMNVGLGGGVAWFAHIGGFLAGIFLVRLFKPRRTQKIWLN
ncbi:MAG: rhomboid family intramembrane serine protease [Candidatus Aminicenantes bacterium]|nr:rhomboid family intramembrane serine protease [Candidatus Aminicenantes bacterium]RLE01834.1 MAG: rhomboid family intramembrane serine protease [Candidatus Aminicenantes bacterium]RLE04192.1 MAG: rhomboid family intramembrane serine protease [Candidatus Aminicenantes bacterium]HHF42892.1 rhomboid family intramembrane serine protease [Candidatus Aminicenantes bacterium]